MCVCARARVCVCVCVCECVTLIECFISLTSQKATFFTLTSNKLVFHCVSYLVNPFNDISDVCDLSLHDQSVLDIQMHHVQLTKVVELVHTSLQLLNILVHAAHLRRQLHLALSPGISGDLVQTES